MNPEEAIERTKAYYYAKRHLEIRFQVDAKTALFGLSDLTCKNAHYTRNGRLSFVRDKEICFEYEHKGELIRAEEDLTAPARPGSFILKKAKRLQIATPPVYDILMILPTLLLGTGRRSSLQLDPETSTTLFVSDWKVIRSSWKTDQGIDVLDLFVDDEGKLTSALLRRQICWETIASNFPILKNVSAPGAAMITDSFKDERVEMIVLQKLLLAE